MLLEALHEGVIEPAMIFSLPPHPNSTQGRGLPLFDTKGSELNLLGPSESNAWLENFWISRSSDALNNIQPLNSYQLPQAHKW